MALLPARLTDGLRNPKPYSKQGHVGSTVLFSIVAFLLFVHLPLSCAAKAQGAFAVFEAPIAFFLGVCAASTAYAAFWTWRVVKYGEKKVFLWILTVAGISGALGGYFVWVAQPSFKNRREQISLFKKRMKAERNFQRTSVQRLKGEIVITRRLPSSFTMTGIYANKEEKTFPFVLNGKDGPLGPVAGIRLPRVPEYQKVTIRNKSRQGVLIAIWFDRTAYAMTGYEDDDWKNIMRREGSKLYEIARWNKKLESLGTVWYGKSRGSLPKTVARRVAEMDPYSIMRCKRYEHAFALRPGEMGIVHSHSTAYPPEAPYGTVFFVHYRAGYKCQFFERNTPADPEIVWVHTGKVAGVVACGPAAFELWNLALAVFGCLREWYRQQPRKKNARIEVLAVNTGQSRALHRRFEMDLAKVDHQIAVRQQQGSSKTALREYLRSKKRELLVRWQTREQEALEKFFRQRTATIEAAENAYKAEERLQTIQERTRMQVENEVSALKAQHADVLDDLAYRPKRRKRDYEHESEMNRLECEEKELDVKEKGLRLDERRKELERIEIPPPKKPRKQTRQERQQEFEQDVEEDMKRWEASGVPEDEIESRRRAKWTAFMAGERKREQGEEYE